MRKKLAEISGTLISMVIVGCVIYFTKSLFQFIVTLLIIGVICIIISWMLSDEDLEPKTIYIVHNIATGDTAEVSKETFQFVQKLNDKLLENNSKFTKEEEEYLAEH